MRSSLFVLSLAAGALLAGCSGSGAPTASAPAPAPTAEESAVATAAVEHDPFSYAEPEKVRIQELELDLDMDFDARQLRGTVIASLDWQDPEAKELVLDTRDLDIRKVEAEGDDGQWQNLGFTLQDADPQLGSRLGIQVPGQSRRVKIEYATSPDASGLQWLTPAMTEGGKLPFMFSQSQQIHARSWVPLQDTPQVRFTYTAHVSTRPDVMVLMSADNAPDAERNGDYRFEMPQSIPSYLLAIAAGDLVFKPISERSGVWAEPPALDRAVAEFEDTERMIEVAEKLYGPYRWGRYDLLILPPSFPYGGMENPRISFITPTAIVGDKSLVSLIAHELTHSWAGNLVTFATPKDQWLNEGITSYVENRIVEELYGDDFATMERAIAQNELRTSMEGMPPQAQALAFRPGTEVDARSTFTGVAYEKGAWFLKYLEDQFGREAFDAFLRGYFDDYAFQSITTAEFTDYARRKLLDANPGKVEMAKFEEWLYEPGIPADAPAASPAHFDEVDRLRQAWLDGGALPGKDVTDAWSTQEWLHFVGRMPEDLSREQLAQLDEAYHFSGTPNGEIAMRWYPLAVRGGHDKGQAQMEDFLQHVGRRKLIIPIYQAMVQTPEGLARAEAVLERSRAGYHPITTVSVEKVIERAKGGNTDHRAE